MNAPPWINSTAGWLFIMGLPLSSVGEYRSRESVMLPLRVAALVVYGMLVCMVISFGAVTVSVSLGSGVVSWLASV